MRSVRAKVRREFDQAYYERFYRDPERRAVSAQESRRQAVFIAGYLKYLELPVSRIVDLGCGPGHLIRALRRQYPAARSVGVDISEYACQRYGWTRGSATDYGARVPFDLVVCYDVVQYLDDANAAEAIANLARLCRGALYFGALTHEDWLHHCDRERTDGQVHLRPTSWYRHHLARSFTGLGGGLHLTRPHPVTLWSLEAGP